MLVITALILLFVPLIYIYFFVVSEWFVTVCYSFNNWFVTVFRPAISLL